MKLADLLKANVVPFVMCVISGYLCGLISPETAPSTVFLMLLGGAVALTALRLKLSQQPRAAILAYGATLALGWNAGYLAFLV